MIPIHSQYVECIFSGVKKYEYRRRAPIREIQYIILYETAPVSLVVGIAEVNECICDTPSKLWNTTKNSSGLSKIAFDKYAEGRDELYAFSLGAVKRFAAPFSVKVLGFESAPQSFCYVSEDRASSLVALLREGLE